MKKQFLTIALLAIGASVALAQGGRGRGYDRDERGRPQYENHDNNGHKYGQNKHYQRSHNNHDKNTQVRVVVNRPVYHHRYVEPIIVRRPVVYVAPRLRTGVYVDLANDRRYFEGRALMRPWEVDNLRNQMDVIRRDNVRLDYAKRNLMGRKIQSRDVAKIMITLEFEENKLELAKYAYRRTIDKRNYELVFNRLATNWAQQELDNYIFSL